MPDRANTKGTRLADLIALHPDHHPFKKDRIILNRQLKQKGSQSYTTPTAFNFFSI
jgi:hypothetical protein